jgi:hypothetical protein
MTDTPPFSGVIDAEAAMWGNSGVNLSREHQHQQVTVYSSLTRSCMSVDTGLRGVLWDLWDMHIPTYASCEGAPHDKEAYVMFGAGYETEVMGYIADTQPVWQRITIESVGHEYSAYWPTGMWSCVRWGREK